MTLPDHDASALADAPRDPADPGVTEVARAPERLAGRKNLVQLIQLRWLAVAGQLFTIVMVQWVLGIELPLAHMLPLLATLALFNAASWLRSRMALPVVNAELLISMLVDVATLTGQLYFAGGITNPFIYLYLLQVAVGSVLLRPAYTWVLVAVTSLCFMALTQWHRTLSLPDMASMVLPLHYIGGLLLCFLINASLLVIFITRISQNLRQRDARLAHLRQRAVEEEHIVRMGLLASGAAHEMGTPLATMSVILGDWARMAPFAGEPELREEIEQMQRQLQRCKTILTSTLQSAGEMRGEAPEETTLHEFLDDLIDHWLLTRTVREFRYDREAVTDVPIIGDSALRQMVDNVLDNALEAEPHGLLRLVASTEDDTLTLRVLDQGPGFAAPMLAQFGKPYQSSKGRPGGGLGLFLSVNVARTLGGTIEAHNRPGRGAEVVITLPLSVLTPSD